MVVYYVYDEIINTEITLQNAPINMKIAHYSLITI